MEPLLITCIIGITSFVYFIIHILTKDHNYWKERNVPHRQPILFFGTDKENLTGKLNVGEMAKKHYEEWPDAKAVGCFRSRWPNLVIRDPDLIRSVLVKDFNNFYRRGDELNYEREKIAQNLFHLNNEKWKPLRRKMTPAFTSSKLRNMFPLILSKGEDFAQCILGKINENDVFDVRDLMSRYTMDVIGTCAFGVNINSMKDRDTPFTQIGKLIFESGLLRKIRRYSQLLFPKLAATLGIRLFNYEVEEFMMKFCITMMNDRIKNEYKRNDFVDLLIELKNKGYISGHNSENINDTDDIKIEVTDEILMAQIFIIFTAGFETSSTATSYALYELALNQNMQEKLYQNILKNTNDDDGRVTYENIKHMDYLDKILKESLRKYPPVSLLTRLSESPYTFPGTQINIGAGCSVTIPILALHHDKKYYPHPERFDPERFSNEEVEKRNPFVYLPFGEGPRNCIGLRFARVQSMIGLIFVIKNFRVEICDKTVKEILFSPRKFISTPIGGIYLRMIPR